MYLSALPAVAEPSSCSDGTYSPTLPSIPTGTAEPSIRFCRAFFLPVPQPRPGSFHTHHCQTAEKMPREEPERTECAILRLPPSEGVRKAENALHNAPRRPSEATTTSSSPKYRKIGNNGISRRFPPGKRQTSDFYGGKFRGFAPKVRRFMSEKSDVFQQKCGIFVVFRGPFSRFCGKKRRSPPKKQFQRMYILTVRDSKTSKTTPFSALKGTRNVVKILEGLRVPVRPSSRRF